MEKVAIIDNDCPSYLPTLSNSEGIRVILLIGHDTADCPYTLVVTIRLSKQRKEEHRCWNK